jgi:hypothetical protein
MTLLVVEGNVEQHTDPNPFARRSCPGSGQPPRLAAEHHARLSADSERCPRCGQEDVDGVRWVDMVDQCIADVCPARDFHDAVCTGPGVPAGFTCSHPQHARLSAEPQEQP